MGLFLVSCLHLLYRIERRVRPESYGNASSSVGHLHFIYRFALGKIQHQSTFPSVVVRCIDAGNDRSRVAYVDVSLISLVRFQAMTIAYLLAYFFTPNFFRFDLPIVNIPFMRVVEYAWPSKFDCWNEQQDYAWIFSSLRRTIIDSTQCHAYFRVSDRFRRLVACLLEID